MAALAKAHYRYQTFWPRFWAALVDGLVMMPLFIAFSLMLVHENVSLRVVGYLLAALSPIAYSVVLHGIYGKTVGKHLNNIRVISVDEARLTFAQAARRDSVLIPPLLFVASIELPMILSGDYPQHAQLEPFVETLFLISGLCVQIWAAAEIVSMLTNRKRRAIHDFLAGSVVVREGISDRPPPPVSKIDQPERSSEAGRSRRRARRRRR